MMEELEPQFISLFGHCLNELSRDDILLALEYMVARDIRPPFQIFDNRRLQQIALHFVNMDKSV